MEQPQYNSYKVRKLDDPEEKKLAILKATQSIEKKFGSNTILNEEGKASQLVQPFHLLSILFPIYVYNL